MLPRPSHPVPNVRDDRETPLCVGRDSALIILIWVSEEAQYFCKRGWTAQSRFARQAWRPVRKEARPHALPANEALAITRSIGVAPI